MLATNVSRSQLPADYSTPNKYVVFNRLWEAGINEDAIARFTSLFNAIDIQSMNGLDTLINEMLPHVRPGGKHVGIQNFDNGGLWYISVQVAPMVESPAGDFDHTSHLTVGVCNDGWRKGGGTLILNPLSRQGELTHVSRPNIRRHLTAEQDALAYAVARQLL